MTALRAAPRVRVKAKIAVKNAVCEESSATADAMFDCEFAFDSHEWSCFNTVSMNNLLSVSVRGVDQAQCYCCRGTGQQVSFTEVMARWQTKYSDQLCDDTGLGLAADVVKTGAGILLVEETADRVRIH